VIIYFPQLIGASAFGEGGVNISVKDIHIRFEMLGGFAIIYDGNRITEQGKSSSKTWKLIQYLVAHRHKTVSRDELIDVFCDSEYADNPGGALRTLVYRARAALAGGGLKNAEDMIVSKYGGYAWNNEMSVSVDAEEFEALCNKAGTNIGEDERLELLQKATALYRGDFLPNSTGELWVMPLARWYRSMYINSAHDAMELLGAKGRNAEAEELCTKALRIDPFDEKMLGHHLGSLVAQGKNAEALEEYNRMETMYYDVLGVNYSENLRELYNQILRPGIDERVPLETIMVEWMEGANFPGAYYCDLSVFKALFQIESRSVPRSGRTAYIVRFDTKNEPNSRGGGVMKQLGMLIPSTLRMGDLFTRSSPNQYMLMLHSLTYEDCKMLIDRIMHGLDSKFLSKVIGTSIKPIKPIM